MKILVALSFALVVPVLGLMPAPARAEPPAHCPNGCYVVTCIDNVCTVWRCGPQGCRPLASVPSLQPQSAPGVPRRDRR